MTVPEHGTPASSTERTQTKRVHEWQPNGSVEISRSSMSPCSTWDDQLWTDVVALAVGRGGGGQRTDVGRKNLRRRGDALLMRGR